MPAVRGKTKPRKNKATEDSDKAGTSALIKKLGTQATLNQTEIAFLWVAMGGPVSEARTASAVAFGESSGNTKAHTPGSCCYGLYQFNVDAKVNTYKCSMNAVCATRSAIKLQKEQGWRPWQAYTGPSGSGSSGPYNQFLSDDHFNGTIAGHKAGSVGHAKGADGQLVAFHVPMPGDILKGGIDGIKGGLDFGTDTLKGGGAIKAGGDAVKAGADVLQAILDPGFVFRVGKILIGVILLIMAANALSKALTNSSIPDHAVNTGVKAGETAATVAAVIPK